MIFSRTLQIQFQETNVLVDGRGTKSPRAGDHMSGKTMEQLQDAERILALV